MLTVLEAYQDLFPAGQVLPKGSGEYAGPCPDCGGKDRFLLWPEHPSGAKGGRYLCRGCGKQGDAIQFLRNFGGMGYTEACKVLGVAAVEPKAAGKAARQDGKLWEPRPETLPPAEWLAKAAEFVRRCAADVASTAGRDMLAARGLTLETARRFRLGYNAAASFPQRGEWGLPAELNRQGLPKKLWLPKGLVLPLFRKAGVTDLLIRRDDWTPGDERPKYVQVAGGSREAFVSGRKGQPVLLVESVLDAILARQEAGDLVATVALTGASKRPDEQVTAFLRESPLVLYSLDFDAAGMQAWTWWQQHFVGIAAWPTDTGKDLGEMVEAGESVRRWVELALEEYGILPSAGHIKVVPQKDEAQAGTDDSTPENQTVGHDVPCQHTSTPLLAEIGRRGEYLLDDAMPIADAIGWLRPWWQRGINFAVRDEGVWLLLRREAARQAEQCLAEVRGAWPAICAALDIPRETSLCGWRRAEG